MQNSKSQYKHDKSDKKKIKRNSNAIWFATLILIKRRQNFQGVKSTIDVRNQ